MQGSRKLVLAHFGAAFAMLAFAIPLGAWQMLVRSPLHRWVDPERYYIAVTAHGSTLAYIFPTLVAMGFGYAVCAVALGRPMRGMAMAWLSLWLVLGGAAMALLTVAGGKATVLYTFYPPLLASAWYYLGILCAVAGSWIWVWLMVWHFRQWKRDHPGLPVPLAMFATTAAALLWAWTSLGVGAEIVFLILPNAFGWTSSIDPGLARVLFSWTCMPSSISGSCRPTSRSTCCCRRPRAGVSTATGWAASPSCSCWCSRCRSDCITSSPTRRSAPASSSCMRCSRAWSRCRRCSRSSPSALRWRSRGGCAAVAACSGWVAALPWQQPMVLASGLSLLMLGLGGAGGLINMSYAMNATVHNTQFVTAHFHLIFGGAVVIMYFAIAYELWPRLTGRALPVGAHAAAAVELVRGHADRDAAMARRRPHGTTQAHVLLRLHGPGAGAAGDLASRCLQSAASCSCSRRCCWSACCSLRSKRHQRAATVALLARHRLRRAACLRSLNGFRRLGGAGGGAAR